MKFIEIILFAEMTKKITIREAFACNKKRRAIIAVQVRARTE